MHSEHLRFNIMRTTSGTAPHLVGSSTGFTSFNDPHAFHFPFRILSRLCKRQTPRSGYSEASRLAHRTHSKRPISILVSSIRQMKNQVSLTPDRWYYSSYPGFCSFDPTSRSRCPRIITPHQSSRLRFQRPLRPTRIAPYSFDSLSRN